METGKIVLREICEYARVNGIPYKFVMRSYVDTVMKWEKKNLSA